MNEAHLRATAERLSRHRLAAGGIPVTFATLGEYLAGTMAALVRVELALVADDERLVRRALGLVAGRVLVCLHDLGQDWALRAPRHRIGRYQTPADLTAGVRHSLSEVWRYMREGRTRDVVIAVELVLKEALELASLLDFDLQLEVGAMESALPGLF